MDNIIIAKLKDSDIKINNLISQLENKFNDINSEDDDFSQIESIQKNISLELESMKFLKNDLKEELNIKIWGKKINEFESKNKDFKQKTKNLPKNKEKNADPENIDKSFDHTHATIEEEYKRGKKILSEDNRILGELIDIVTKDGETLMIVKQKLEIQNKQLEELPFDEMEYSLKRAGAKIRKMMKMALKDNIAKCLIAVISIIILTIIIISLCEGKTDNNYNLPLDIFSSNKNGININNNNTSSYEYSFYLGNKLYYTILILLLLFL